MGGIWFLIGYLAARGQERPVAPVDPLVVSVLCTAILLGCVTFFIVEIKDHRRVARAKVAQDARYQAWLQSDRKGPPPRRPDWVWK